MQTEHVKEQAKGFFNDGLLLMRKELQLAKVEINEKLNQVQSGMIMVVVGILAGFIGLIFLGHTAVAYLATEFSEPVAYLLVSAIFLLISAAILLSAKSKLSAEELKPHRTINAAKAATSQLGGK